MVLIKKECSSPVEVLSVLRDFRRTKKFCDITLKCGERNFYAQYCVLAAVSPYFLAMFRSGMSEVCTMVKCVDLAFLSVSPAAVSTVLDYIYGEVIELDIENALDLLAVADYMLLGDLKNDVCEFVSDMLSLDRLELCFSSRRYAEMYGCKKLYDNTNCFIKAMFCRLSQTSAFCNLTLEEFEFFLESDELSANEDEVFVSIIKWVNHSLDDRKNCFQQLLTYVQPGTLSKDYYMGILAQYDIFDEELFKTTIDPSSDSGRQGRQGQEVILVFDNEDSQAYIPGLKPWHPIAKLPEAKQNFKVATLNGFVYVLGGLTVHRLSLTVWRYDPRLNCWKIVAPMLKTGASIAVAVLAGCLYVTLGPNPNYSMQKYDPVVDVWSFCKPMLVTRQDHCMVAFQDKYLVVIGGYTPTSTTSLYTVERYDSETCTWSYMPQLNIGRIESSAVALQDNIYVVGGYSGTGTSTSSLSICEVYNSSINQWSFIEPTIIPRRNAAITIYHGEVYVLGGTSKRLSAMFEHYCEETKSWNTEDSHSVCRFSSFSQCCTVTLSGKQICDWHER